MALIRTPPMVDPTTLRPGDIIAAPNTRRTLIIVDHVEPPASPIDLDGALPAGLPVQVIHGSHIGTGAVVEIPLDDGEQVALHRPANPHHH